MQLINLFHESLGVFEVSATLLAHHSKPIPLIANSLTMGIYCCNVVVLQIAKNAKYCKLPNLTSLLVFVKTGFFLGKTRAIAPNFVNLLELF